MPRAGSLYPVYIDGLADTSLHANGQTVLSRIIKSTPDTWYEAMCRLRQLRSFDQIRFYRVAVVVVGDGRDDCVNVAIFEKLYERLLVRVVNHQYRNPDFFFQLWTGLNLSDIILNWPRYGTSLFLPIYTACICWS